MAAGRLRLIRNTRREASDGLGRAVPRPGGCTTRCTRCSRRCSSRASSTTPTPTGRGRGRHRGHWRATSGCAPRHRHVLRGDVYRYFPAIDHEVLKRNLRRRIACRQTLAVLDRIVDGVESAGAGESVLSGRRPLHAVRIVTAGLLIGNLTRQLFASACTSTASITSSPRVLRAPYLRYVDDVRR